jgi:hypothetical protein
MSIGGRLNRGLELDCEEACLYATALSLAGDLSEAPINNPPDCGAYLSGVLYADCVRWISPSAAIEKWVPDGFAKGFWRIQ